MNIYMRILNLFSKHICQADCVNDARDGVVPHCFPEEGSYGLRFVPGLGEVAAAEALANYSRLASKSRKSPRSPKSPMAPKSAPNLKPRPKSSPTPQPPQTSAPKPASPSKCAPTPQSKRRMSLFPKLSSSSPPSPKSSRSSSVLSSSTPSSSSSRALKHHRMQREPRKLGNLPPLQPLLGVKPSPVINWLPRKAGPSRRSNPIKDEDHEECVLRGGVRKYEKSSKCKSLLFQVRCSEHRVSCPGSLLGSFFSTRKVGIIT